MYFYKILSDFCRHLDTINLLTMDLEKFWDESYKVLKESDWILEVSDWVLKQFAGVIWWEF